MTPEEHIDAAESWITDAWDANQYDPMSRALGVLTALTHATIAAAQIAGADYYATHRDDVQSGDVATLGPL